jgi:hypothetical protein
MFVLLLRRAGRLLATTRDAERFRRQASDLCARVERQLSGVSDRIDGLRRGQLGAEAITDELSAALEAVRGHIDEGRALRAPFQAEPIRAGIVDELERARRALEMVEHGCSIQMNARVGSRELESQTAIKRGYLNVLHAREAITRHAAEAAGVIPSDPAHRRPARRIV